VFEVSEADFQVLEVSELWDVLFRYTERVVGRGRRLLMKKKGVGVNGDALRSKGGDFKHERLI
jgi:hypothetical protein